VQVGCDVLGGVVVEKWSKITQCGPQEAFKDAIKEHESFAFEFCSACVTTTTTFCSALAAHDDKTANTFG